MQGIHDDLLLLDPTEKEESLCLSTLKKSKAVNHGVIMQAILTQHEQISEFFFVGSMDVQCINSTMEAINKRSEEIHSVLQESLTKSVLKMLRKRKKGGE